MAALVSLCDASPPAAAALSAHLAALPVGEQLALRKALAPHLPALEEQWEQPSGASQASGRDKQRQMWNPAANPAAGAGPETPKPPPASHDTRASRRRW
eukprot:524048-Prorocentrum_minimum.AAC.1